MNEFTEDVYELLSLSLSERFYYTVNATSLLVLINKSEENCHVFLMQTCE